MDEATYHDWWPLHLRVARGQALSSADQERYEAGLRELQADEELTPQPDGLGQAHAAVARLDEQRATLDARRRELDEQIEALERLLRRPAQGLSAVR